MNEEYIERIEEAVTGEELFRNVARAFRSLGVPEDLETNVANPVELTQAEFDELTDPLPQNNLYFITDG